jgi:hypothetical protein
VDGTLAYQGVVYAEGETMPVGEAPRSRDADCVNSCVRWTPAMTCWEETLHNVESLASGVWYCEDQHWAVEIPETPMGLCDR